MRTIKYVFTSALYGLGGFVLSSAPFGGGARADSPQLSHTITIGGTSNYLFRGISLTDKKPAAQGSIDLSYGMFYTGVWASNTSSDSPFFGQGLGPAEIDFYGGFKPVWGPATFDFGAIAYTYLWGKNAATGSGDFTYYELKAGVSGEIWKGLTGSVTNWIAPSQANAPVVYTIEGATSYTFRPIGIFTPTYSSLLGYSDARVEDPINPAGVGWFPNVKNDYLYWNSGISLTVDKFTMDFRYWGTNLDDPDGLGADRFVFSAKVVLP
ncbi:MAG: TorF family putative porin [Hyphomicrobium sp.]